jgi:hypothetical protein
MHNLWYKSVPETKEREDMKTLRAFLELEQDGRG